MTNLSDVTDVPEGGGKMTNNFAQCLVEFQLQIEHFLAKALGFCSRG